MIGWRRCVRFICSSTPGRNTNWLRNIISLSRRKFRHTGSTIVGPSNGRIWSRLPTSTNTLKAALATGLSRPRNSFILGSDFPHCRRVFGKNPIYIRCRRIRSARRTLTLPAGISIWKTTSVRSKVSSRMRAGSSPRTMSLVTDIISKRILDRKFPIY